MLDLCRYRVLPDSDQLKLKGMLSIFPLTVLFPFPFFCHLDDRCASFHFFLKQDIWQNTVVSVRYRYENTARWRAGCECRFMMVSFGFSDKIGVGQLQKNRECPDGNECHILPKRLSAVAGCR